MANWSDPNGQATAYTQGGVTSSATFDAGLRSHMLKVYNYMISAVLLSGIVAMLFSWGDYSSPAYQIMAGGGPLAWIIRLAPLGFILVLSFGINKLSTGAAQVVFWAFAIAMGLSLSGIFLAYSNTAISTAFFSTAAAFAGLSLFGYTTKKSLSGLGTFLIMGVVGLIVASLLNVFFLKSGTMELVISALGVLIFAGLTAYDTQRIKEEYAYVAGTDYAGKAVIMAALSLYLDFVNMFLYILRLFGSDD